MLRHKNRTVAHTMINLWFSIIFHVIVQLFTITMVYKCLSLDSRKNKNENKNRNYCSPSLHMQRVVTPSVNLTYGHLV